VQSKICLNLQLKSLTMSQQTQYPEWHNNPFRLTATEMQNPHVVLKDFFSAYHLTDIRECLTEWLYSAFHKDEVPAINYVYLHDNIERLIEAAWLLHNKKTINKQKKKKK
jgi:hypothetical protein